MKRRGAASRQTARRVAIEGSARPRRATPRPAPPDPDVGARIARLYATEAAEVAVSRLIELAILMEPSSPQVAVQPLADMLAGDALRILQESATPLDAIHRAVGERRRLTLLEIVTAGHRVGVPK